MNVVTLVPSATEICYALGVEPAGVSHACDRPTAATVRPTLTTTTVDGTGASQTVDGEVATAGQEGNHVYAIDRAALAAADPELIITQGVCEVCAVDRVLVTETVEAIGLDVEILTLDPHSLDDVFESILAVGSATGRTERARTMVTEFRQRVRTVRGSVADGERRPRVTVLDWMDPVMVAGHWISGMVDDAGGRYGLEAPGGRSRSREWSTVREYDPEILVVAPCGFDLEQTIGHLAELTERPGWAELSAVADGRAYVMDGHHHVNRPGPRLIDTLEHLASLIHPERFEAPSDHVVRPVTSAVVGGD